MAQYLNDSHRPELPTASSLPPIMKFNSLLHMAIPQAAYVRDRHGNPTCHLVFSYDDLRQAGIGHELARDWYQDYSTRSSFRRLLYADESLLAQLQVMYSDDVDLWQRVRIHAAATPSHRPLSEYLAEAQQQVPLLRRAHRRPSCGVSSKKMRGNLTLETAVKCTHASCCGASFLEAFSSAQRPRLSTSFGVPIGKLEAAQRRCTACVLDASVGERARFTLIQAGGSVVATQPSQRSS